MDPPQWLVSFQLKPPREVTSRVENFRPPRGAKENMSDWFENELKWLFLLCFWPLRWGSWESLKQNILECAKLETPSVFFPTIERVPRNNTHTHTEGSFFLLGNGTLLCFEGSP